MGPPGFSECFVCHREFGSRSLEFHEPQCLERWRWDNNKLPKSERKKAPSPPPTHPLHKSNQQPTPPAKSPSPTLQSIYTNPNKLSNSWPDSSSTYASNKHQRPRSSSQMGKKKLTRPFTATLEKPKILDMNLKHEIDMSKMSRKMMDTLVLRKDSKMLGDYSGDFSSSSSSSMSCKSPYDEEYLESETENRKRPSTIKVKRPSSNISVPVISHSNSQPLPRRGKTATIRSSLSLKKRLEMAEDILKPKSKIKVPEPCLTCGKEQNPERFHSHPKYLTKFKAKDKLTKERSVEIPYKTISKLIVTKPNPLKYKSRRSVEQNSLSNLSKETNSKSSVQNIRSVKAQKIQEKKVKLIKRNGVENLTPSIAEGPESSDSELKVTNANNDRTSLAEIFQNNGKKSNKIGKTIQKVNSNGKLKVQEEKKVQLKEEDHYGPLEDFTHLQKPVPNKRPSAASERSANAPVRICYICGREFGTRSLKIHEPQCLEKWKRENNRLPDHQQRQEPKRPPNDLSKEEWNDYAWNVSQSQLVPCENCGRTFFPDRLEIHQRGCKVSKKSQPDKEKQKEKAREREQSPIYGSTGRGSARPMVLCYICGREFGTKSVAIHEPQCLTKWKNENAKLPPHLQRPEPAKPKLVVDEEGRVNKEAMVEAAWQSHLETLVKCEGCGRTFFPDRLIIHQKSCKQFIDKENGK